ncbi:hypothetical protein PLESTB_001559200 [Pleodorina starrii]|uniref:Cilium assembly protein DZIP1 N-terminal domain-containing protein n=1 Tax=Pleodorina starrii TaxID=330485 RepID=A0A9W6F885_9CHLO|nr:hypothetical protein PLESTB_001559200 [Pleodorina starrii]GLC72803.1 hypothetical protein PLESTF_001294800 [Pleodorina starrii]
MTTTFPRTMGYGLGASLQRGASAFGPWVDPYDYPQRDQTMTTAPSFPPFKFEPRRSRIDWRLLHGIDINAMMRDVDLDTLEKIVNIVAFGDIEAEDTRHLTELNFIKIFRLSQMMIEYLLYVQDCLQNSNGWLQQDRANMDKYVQAARLRIRELEAHLKMNKRELRRSRKTIKTYELLAVLNDGGKGGTGTLNAAATGTATTAFTTFGTAAAHVSPGPPPPQPQAARPEPNPVNVAMEALLRKELAVLGERLSKATLECQTLRSERDELFQAVKDVEATVKARSQLSGASSPLIFARQNGEAAQAIQGLQDQLSRATVEIAKLRNEKADMSEELEQANAERRQLQDEKSRLLSELATRPAESPAGRSESPRAGDNLGSMLLEADRQKAALQDQLSDARAEIAALQKQLMKAMKDTALGPLPSSQSQSVDDRALRELEAAKAALERELADMRRTYNEDVQQLQEELEGAQARAVEADRRLSKLAAAQRDSSTRASPPRSAGGFVKIVEERRSPSGTDDPDHGADRQRALLAEYEATNERLNQQLIQIKSERNALASEVEQLRLRPPNRGSPSPGDQSIGRDWRTEEIDRLKEERDAAHRRILDLEDALHDRDALVERLRATIRDLQAQLDESNRQQAGVEAGPSRVKQQVKHFERLADPAKPPQVQVSFSFAGGDSPPSSVTVAETPTSVRKHELPPPGSPLRSRSPSPSAATPPIPEEPERTSGGFLPPSPRRPGQALGPSQESRWLRRIQRPTEAEATAIQLSVLRHVAGQGPEALEMMIQDEIRVITENPYEYAGDDEERFRALMPHEMADRKGVRSVSHHVLEDLATARALYTDQLLAVLDDEVAQYGVDPTGSTLADKAYLACMRELGLRRSQLLERYPKEVQERAEDLRSFLLTHLELVKRGEEQQFKLRQQQELQQQLQQQKLQQQQQQQQTQQQQQQTQQPLRSSTAGGEGHLDEEDELEPDDVAPAPAAPAAVVAPAAVPSGSGSGATQQQERDLARISQEELVTAVTFMPNQGIAAATEAAARPLSTISTTGAGAAGGPAQRQLPAFPSRQPSGTGAAAGTEDLRSMLPPAPGGSRPASGTTQQLAVSQRSTPAQSQAGGAGSTNLSREASASGRDDPADRPSSTAVAKVQPMRASSSSSSGGSDPRQASMRSGQSSLPRSGTTTPGGQPQVAAGGSGYGAAAAATPVMLTRQVTPSSPERVTLGHARPTPVARPGAAAAATPGGNMNMSIRSVKYQESDLDDDEEDVVPLPQPKPVRRVADDDEYALTEDEETQQDMGIEDSEDFSVGARQPKILMTGGSPNRPAVPSRLGPQPTPATAQQSRGWATEEPLQPAPAKPRASQPPSEAGEVQLLDSIQSFDNPNNDSMSMKRSPGAWGSPSATMRKPSGQSVREQRETSVQMSVTSKHSGWNEAITSFGVASGTGDDVQDFTESFTESSRPIGRMMGQRAPAAAASKAHAPPQPRVIPRQNSFDDDLSEIEYA